MDILNAEPYEVDGRVYRLIHPIQDVSISREEEKEFKPLRPYIEEEDDFDPDLPINHQGDKFYITFNIPELLVRPVVGRQHMHIRNLERHGASINSGKDGVTTISGPNKLSVANTYYSFMDRVSIYRMKKESTHFISLPVNFANIQESFLNFKKEILEKHKRVRGIDESIFQKPKRLHVTIVPLVLLDKRDNQNAIALLSKCMGDILKNFAKKEFRVRVKGLEYMNDDPAEVDVLYAQVEELDGDNRLQIIADSIMNAFCDANFSRKQHDRVKLHITLINTLFRVKLENKDDDDEESVERKTFDARPILKEYINYDFGEVVMDEIHISVRYTEAQDGYYRAIKKIKLNS